MRLKKSVHENTRWVIRVLASRVASASAVRSRGGRGALRLGRAGRHDRRVPGRAVDARLEVAVQAGEVDEAHDPGREDRQGERRHDAQGGLAKRSL